MLKPLTERDTLNVNGGSIIVSPVDNSDSDNSTPERPNTDGMYCMDTPFGATYYEQQPEPTGNGGYNLGDYVVIVAGEKCPANP